MEEVALLSENIRAFSLEFSKRWSSYQLCCWGEREINFLLYFFLWKWGVVRSLLFLWKPKRYFTMTAFHFPITSEQKRHQAFRNHCYIYLFACGDAKVNQSDCTKPWSQRQNIEYLTIAIDHKVLLSTA